MATDWPSIFPIFYYYPLKTRHSQRTIFCLNSTQVYRKQALQIEEILELIEKIAEPQKNSSLFFEDFASLQEFLQTTIVLGRSEIK